MLKKVFIIGGLRRGGAGRSWEGEARRSYRRSYREEWEELEGAWREELGGGRAGKTYTRGRAGREELGGGAIGGDWELEGV